MMCQKFTERTCDNGFQRRGFIEANQVPQLADDPLVHPYVLFAVGHRLQCHVTFFGVKMLAGLDDKLFEPMN
jgi:hypothetical protein